MIAFSSATATLVVAALACAAWSFAILLRGGVWRAAERDDAPEGASSPLAVWPGVVAVVGDPLGGNKWLLCHDLYSSRKVFAAARSKRWFLAGFQSSAVRLAAVD